MGRRKNLLASLFVFGSFVCFHRYLVNGRKHEPVYINSLGELSNNKSRSTMESMDVSDKFLKNCVPRNSRLIIYLKKSTGWRIPLSNSSRIWMHFSILKIHVLAG